MRWWDGVVVTAIVIAASTTCFSGVVSGADVDSHSPWPVSSVLHEGGSLARVPPQPPLHVSDGDGPTVYYVSSTGSDHADGVTAATAWATVSEAVKRVSATLAAGGPPRGGVEVRILPGLYQYNTSTALHTNNLTGEKARVHHMNAFTSNFVPPPLAQSQPPPLCASSAT